MSTKLGGVTALNCLGDTCIVQNMAALSVF